jgi:hypothetical protein
MYDSTDHPLWPALGEEDDATRYLREMANYPGPMAVLCEALKKEGVRFDETRFCDGQITHQNQYVTIIRGDAADFLHRAIEGIEHRKARQKMWQRNLSSYGLVRFARQFCLQAYNCANTSFRLLKFFHNRSLPNVQAH